VGVAATPESIEFIKAGEGHERLGEGIKDTVVLSAGGRLEGSRQSTGQASRKNFGQNPCKKSITLKAAPKGACNL
jgi:hypothetical protein